MTRLSICKRLAPLASFALQKRYIEGATRESYLLPEDVLNDVQDAVRLSKAYPILSPEQKQAMSTFEAILNSATPNLDAPKFIRSDPVWCTLRDAAASCLITLGFDLAAWEAKELGDFEHRKSHN